MNKVVCPGSFDPITIGHLDIIARAAQTFDEVIVLIMKNVEKQGFFSYEQRKELVELATKDLKNVKVRVHTGLLTDYMREHNIKSIVKGLRNIQDFEYELDMALINKTLDPEAETVFLIAQPQYRMVSSSAVRELISYKADISDFVPENVRTKINEYFN